MSKKITAFFPTVKRAEKTEVCSAPASFKNTSCLSQPLKGGVINDFGVKGNTKGVFCIKESKTKEPSENLNEVNGRGEELYVSCNNNDQRKRKVDGGTEFKMLEKKQKMRMTDVGSQKFEGKSCEETSTALLLQKTQYVRCVNSNSTPGIKACDISKTPTSKNSYGAREMMTPIKVPFKAQKEVMLINVSTGARGMMMPTKVPSKACGKLKTPTPVENFIKESTHGVQMKMLTKAPFNVGETPKIPIRMMNPMKASYKPREIPIKFTYKAEKEITPNKASFSAQRMMTPMEVPCQVQEMRTKVSCKAKEEMSLKSSSFGVQGMITPIKLPFKLRDEVTLTKVSSNAHGMITPIKASSKACDAPKMTTPVKSLSKGQEMVPLTKASFKVEETLSGIIKPIKSPYKAEEELPFGKGYFGARGMVTPIKIPYKPQDVVTLTKISPNAQGLLMPMKASFKAFDTPKMTMPVKSFSKGQEMVTLTKTSFKAQETLRMPTEMMKPMKAPYKGEKDIPLTKCSFGSRGMMTPTKELWQTQKTPIKSPYMPQAEVTLTKISSNAQGLMTPTKASFTATNTSISTQSINREVNFAAQGMITPTKSSCKTPETPKTPMKASLRVEQVMTPMKAALKTVCNIPKTPPPFIKGLSKEPCARVQQILELSSPMKQGPPSVPATAVISTVKRADPIPVSIHKNVYFEHYTNLELKYGKELPLPKKFYDLRNSFRAWETCIKMELKNKCEQLVELKAVMQGVRKITNKAFTLGQVGQIMTVLPSTYFVEKVDGKLFFRVAGRDECDALMGRDSLWKRVEIFNDRLLQYVINEHKKFIRINFPGITEEDIGKIKRWSMTFDLEAIADIPIHPEIRKLCQDTNKKDANPPGISTLLIQPNSIAKVVADMNKDGVSVAKNELMVYANSNLKLSDAIKKKIEEKRRAKGASAMKFMTLTDEDCKKLVRIRRLPVIARDFFSQIRNRQTLRYDEVAKTLWDKFNHIHCFLYQNRTLSMDEIKEHISMLTEVVPGWFRVEEETGQVIIMKHVDWNDALSCLLEAMKNA